MRRRKIKKNGRLVIILGALFFTWCSVLFFLMLIYPYINLKRKDQFMVEITSSPEMLLVGKEEQSTEIEQPEEVKNEETEIKVSEKQEVSLEPKLTEAPSFYELPEITGDEKIDADIRSKAMEFAGDEKLEMEYETYFVGNYLSIVFYKKTEYEGEITDTLLPLVYNLSTKEQVCVSDMIKESYFAIIKERLQKEAEKRFEDAKETDFITYKEIYRLDDYKKFYLTEDKLVFWFDENSLFEKGHLPFSYEVPLEEAKAFFFFNLDGTRNGIPIRELDADAPMIAFTFDDGPQFVDGDCLDNIDLKLVDLFKQYNGRATFFFVGERISQKYKSSYAKIPKLIYEEGFEVGSHTYSHTVDFSSDNEDKKEIMWKEFNLTNEIIARTTGHAPDYIRLPGGSIGKWSMEFPMPIINWSIDSIDYREKNKENGAEIILQRILEKNYKDGDIILLHSLYENSYEAVKMLLEVLSEKGYQFVTLSELFYYKGITPENGEIYCEINKMESNQSQEVSEKKIMEDALFIGDSRTVGLMEYSDLKEATFFSAVGMSVYNIWEREVSVPKAGKVTLEKLLDEKQYGKIYVMLGINELGYRFEQTVNRYRQFIDRIMEEQPNAKIFVMANLHVTKRRSEKDNVINNKAIDKFNNAISVLADNKNIFYLDVNFLFDDKEGNLDEKKAFDNAHIYAGYYIEWSTWIRNKTKEMLQKKVMS